MLQISEDSTFCIFIDLELYIKILLLTSLSEFGGVGVPECGTVYLC